MKLFPKLLQATLALLFLLSLAACDTLGVAAPSQPGAIRASGVIEASEIAVSPQTGGRVVEVAAQEGQAVKSGDVLLRLDDSLLQAQRQEANAALEAAKAGVQTAQSALDAANAQYQVVLQTALQAEQSSRTLDWTQPVSGTFEQPAWYFTHAEQMQAAQSEVDAARMARDAAQTNLEQVTQDSNNANFLSLENRLAQARLAYQVANLVYNRSQKSDRQELRDAGQDVYNDAQDELERAQQAYDEKLTTQAAKDVLKARSKLAIAQERYATAQDTLRNLQTGEFSPQVTSAQTLVKQAQDALHQAQTGVQSAQAQIDLIDAQNALLVVHAPQNGVVLTRSIEPGEVIQGGMTALTIAQLDHLKLTVYISEDRYGQISLGDHAKLLVDSYPEETFDAVVARIADKAEYTPRNVQTAEERQNTVYAVELSITNPQGKLIPGMPVDVEFMR